jgi:hypothetical protein
MTFYLGTKGNVRLRRGSSAQMGALAGQIAPDDVNTSLNRIGFENAVQNILTGDRIDLETDDPRGLVCFPASAWSDNAVNSAISAYVNVNGAGGLRFFSTFQDAVNNTRENEIAVAAFADEPPLPVTVRIRDVSFNILGNVVGYEFNTDRATIDTTALDDRFKQQVSAGLISGAGRIDCAFDYLTSGITESPLLMLQLVQRVEIGSEFDLALYLTDKAVDPNVENIFYNLKAVVTRAGIQVRAGDIIDCSIDFVTSGEIQLIFGKPSAYILKEDDDRIQLNQSLDFLLQEVED